jgi:hypothetical protein
MATILAVKQTVSLTNRVVDNLNGAMSAGTSFYQALNLSFYASGEDSG